MMNAITKAFAWLIHWLLFACVVLVIPVLIIWFFDWGWEWLAELVLIEAVIVGIVGAWKGN